MYPPMQQPPEPLHMGAHLDRTNWDLGPPHPPKVETVQNQFFHDHDTLPNKKLFKITSFKTTTPSKSRNCSKSVLSRPPHPPKVETVKNQFFQDHHTLPKIESVQNQFFQDHHTLPKYKLFKISSFKTTTPSQSRNCSKSLLSRPPHPPKVETVQNQFYHDHHTLPK